MFQIEWSSPEKIKIGSLSKWIRKFKIPTELIHGFFYWWKKNKIKFITDGFSVYKDNNNWYLTETKFNPELFRKFGENRNNKNELPPDDGFILTPVEINTKEGLRPWQVESVGYLIAALNKWGSAADGSDLGSGKSYSACGVARELNYNVVVICPKAVVEHWRRVVVNHFKMEDKLIDITNYEQLRIGKKDSKIASFIINKKTFKEEFVWKIPKDTLIIFDEAHRLKNFKTKNSKTCISAFKQGYKMLFCSATLATNPLEMRTIGTCLKLFNGSKEYYKWVYSHGAENGDFGIIFDKDNEENKKFLLKLNKDVFEKRGTRLKRDEIPNFPESEIISECYNMDDKDVTEINRINDEMVRELSAIDKKEEKDKENKLTIILRQRQRIELVKVPLFIDMIEEGVEQGMSVVVFVNFTETINAISKRLNIKCVFDGKTPDKIRQQNVDNFQTNKERIILVNITSGGAGLSLNDLNGNYPRLSLISPTFSATLLRQSTGRVWRENSKSKSIQKIVFVEGTIENKVCKNVQSKLNNLDLLNDGDLIEK